MRPRPTDGSRAPRWTPSAWGASLACVQCANAAVRVSLADILAEGNLQGDAPVGSAAGMPAGDAHLGGSDTAATGQDSAGRDDVSRTTAAMRRAMALVAAEGCGTVIVPAGHYSMGPVNLTSNLLLWFDEGVVISAITDYFALPVLQAVSSYGPAGAPKSVWERQLGARKDLRGAVPRFQSLFYGQGLENVTISGGNGTLDGNGRVWWNRWVEGPLLGRPHLIQFENSRDVRLENITLLNPGFWAVHLWRCTYVHVAHMSILVRRGVSRVWATNTDGVNPDSSQHVVIEDSYFQTGDDSIAIKSGWDCWGRAMGVPTKNVTIQRCVFNHIAGSNAAGVAIGSEMSGGVEDILIQDCLFPRTGVAVEVKVGMPRGGYVRGIVGRNLTIGFTKRSALCVMAAYPEQNPFCKDLHPPPPKIRNVSFSGVSVLGPSEGHVVRLTGAPRVHLLDVQVHNFSAHRAGGWSCEFVSGNASDVREAAFCPGLQLASRGASGSGFAPGRPASDWSAGARDADPGELEKSRFRGQRLRPPADGEGAGESAAGGRHHLRSPAGGKPAGQRTLPDGPAGEPMRRRGRVRAAHGRPQGGAAVPAPPWEEQEGGSPDEGGVWSVRLAAASLPVLAALAVKIAWPHLPLRFRFWLRRCRRCPGSAPAGELPSELRPLEHTSRRAHVLPRVSRPSGGQGRPQRRPGG